MEGGPCMCKHQYSNQSPLAKVAACSCYTRPVGQTCTRVPVSSKEIECNTHFCYTPHSCYIRPVGQTCTCVPVSSKEIECNTHFWQKEKKFRDFNQVVKFSDSLLFVILLFRCNYSSGSFWRWVCNTYYTHYQA